MKREGAKCILVADDSKLFLFLSETIFKRIGSRVVTASTGMQALQLANEILPDIVMLDLIMPDIRGDEICAKLKTDPKTSHIPVIIVTVCASPEEIEKCMKAGCDDFISKPVDQEMLLRKVGDLLNIPHRKQIRILVRIDVKAKGGGKSFFGTTENMSEGGMFLISDYIIDSGDAVKLRFFLPGSKEEVYATAHVLRVDKESYKKSYGYGLRFSDISEESLKLIRHFIVTKVAHQ
jgi:uncharacterized protein (TIGR02266 family)